MTLATDALYLNDPEYLLSVFDLRYPEGLATLHRLRDVHAEYSEIEALDEDHFVLIVRPGWASEPAA